MPLVAQAASWMEMTKLPLHEVRRRYTKSEMMMAAWRNGEISYNMESKRIPTAAQEVEAYVPKSLLEKATTSEGELDLRNLSDDEVFQYFNSIGMPVARMG